MDFEIYPDKYYIRVDTSFGKYLIFFEEIVEFANGEKENSNLIEEGREWLRENIATIEKLYPEIFL